jgi:hypothetical protein
VTTAKTTTTKGDKAMTDPTSEFLDAGWIERYRASWNADAQLVADLHGFDALIEYGWKNRDRPSAFIRVENGRATSAAWGEAPGKPDFVMLATPENWQRLRDGSLSGRAALLTKKLDFKGSMITAMKYMGPFEKSLALLGSV